MTKGDHDVDLPSPKEWGPHLWSVMHLGPKLLQVDEFYNNGEPTEVKKKELSDGYYTFSSFMPCDKCKNHYQSLLTERPPEVDSSEQLAEWLAWVSEEVSKNVKKMEDENNWEDTRAANRRGIKMRISSGANASSTQANESLQQKIQQHVQTTAARKAKRETSKNDSRASLSGTSGTVTKPANRIIFQRFESKEKGEEKHHMPPKTPAKKKVVLVKKRPPPPPPPLKEEVEEEKHKDNASDSGLGGGGDKQPVALQKHVYQKTLIEPPPQQSTVGVYTSLPVTEEKEEKINNTQSRKNVNPRRLEQRRVTSGTVSYISQEIAKKTLPRFLINGQKLSDDDVREAYKKQSATRHAVVEKKKQSCKGCTGGPKGIIGGKGPLNISIRRK